MSSIAFAAPFGKSPFEKVTKTWVRKYFLALFCLCPVFIPLFAVSY